MLSREATGGRSNTFVWVGRSSVTLRPALRYQRIMDASSNMYYSRKRRSFKGTGHDYRFRAAPPARAADLDRR